MTTSTHATRKRRRSYRPSGPWFARLLCVFFGLIGVLPMAAAMLTQTLWARTWAAQTVSQILLENFGLTARFQVLVVPWPLAIEARQVEIDSTDGSAMPIRVERLRMEPRFFSLIAGRLDLGDIEVEKPQLRLSIHDGGVTNLRIKPQPTPQKSAPIKRMPFASIAINEASFDLDIDGTRLKANEVDVDLSAEEGPVFELSLKTGSVSIDRQHRMSFSGSLAPEAVDAFDSDLICRLDARAQITPSSVAIRRLRLFGTADLDPSQQGQASCSAAEEDLSRVSVELRNVRASLDDEGIESATGEGSLRGPLRLVNRFVTFPIMQGWTKADVSELYWKRGQKLPNARVRLTGQGISLGIYRLARTLDLRAHLQDEVLKVPTGKVGFADGTVDINNLEIRPFDKGMPIKASSVDLDKLQISGLMRDLGITDHTHVHLFFKDGTLAQVDGTLDPLHIDSEFLTHLSDFEVYDAAFDDPARKKVLGVRTATLKARFAVRPNAVEFQNARADFGNSSLGIYSSLGFNNEFRLRVDKGSKLDLHDVSPIVDIPWSGRAELGVTLDGVYSDPRIVADLAIAKFEFAGFSFGDITSAKVVFRPLVLDLTDIEVRKEKSAYRLPTMQLDFNGPATVALSAAVESQSLNVRDFFSILRFDQDPRFTDIDGEAKVSATIQLDLGGPRDLCGGGRLDVRAKTHINRLSLLGERFDDGDVDFDYRWIDQTAQELGVEVDIRSARLRKGSGTIVGNGTIRPGGIVRAQVIASKLPLSKIQAISPMGMLLDGSVSATAEVRGTTDRLEADIDARISPIGLGNAVLPASRVAVRLTPIDPTMKIIGHSRCGQPILSGFDRSEWAKDRSLGQFRINGSLLGGQILLQDLDVTRQRSQQLSGVVAMNRLDLGALAQIFPSVASSETPPSGNLTGQLDVQHLAIDAPENASVRLSLSALEFATPEGVVRLREGTQAITLKGDDLQIPGVALELSSKGLTAAFQMNGGVHHLAKAPELDLTARLLPTNLSALAGMLPRVERAQGLVEASVKIVGSPMDPSYSGFFTLRGGAVGLTGSAMSFESIDVDVELSEHEIRLAKATAMVGGGSVSASGTMPVSGFDLGTASGKLVARGVSLPVTDGISAVIDADLSAAWAARVAEEKRTIPKVVGDITIQSFEYTRPIAISADIGALAQKGKRTQFESYEPADDFVDFDVRLRASRPLTFRNNLVDMQLVVDSGALILSGTNQRMGLRGELRVKPGGRVRLRSSEFEIRQGSVRFDDSLRIHPTVDVSAVTEYRRYSQAQGQGTSPGAAASTASTVGKAGGQWRIQLHAHGDADDLRLDLSSEPNLSQEDIVLLLTLGVTRAELDQMQASNLGSTAALEALSTLTGADSAVKGAIPVIDDFRLGSAYSSRTGRTEPTVNIGKRLTERVRANVTSGVSENREIRSNIEWQLTPKTSVMGSYDNVNNVSSSALGNLGADIRFRIEFQ